MSGFFYLYGTPVSYEEFLTGAATATAVWVQDCPSLKSLPPLPEARNVWVYHWMVVGYGPSLDTYAGSDSRGYGFYAVHARGEWRVVADCRCFTFDEARTHWGPGGQSDRPDCLALVNKLAQIVKERPP